MNSKDTLLQDEASRWVARMGRSDWGDAHEADLANWLAQNPRGQGELLMAQAAWISCDPETIALGQPPVTTPSWSRRRIMLAGSAAAMAASIFGLVFYNASVSGYATEVGEVRRVALADGSTAAINTDTRIAVNFDKGHRNVRLDRGEVWFQVKHDRARPFVVEAGPVRVRAVGTAFSVRRRGNGADIIVTEGVVAAWTDANANEPVSARAGTQLFMPDTPGRQRPVAIEASAASSLSWRSGQIELVARPLADAAAEFNRYNRRKIVIHDPTIANEEVDGIFRTDDPEGFATAVHDILGVPVRTSGDGEITLGRK